MPSCRLGLERLARSAVRMSHKQAFIPFVVANSDCDDDVFQLMLVMRSEDDRVGSIARRPIKGLRLCPLASQTRTPHPRAAASNSGESFDCGWNDKDDTVPAKLFFEDAWLRTTTGVCGRETRNNAIPFGPATAATDDTYLGSRLSVCNGVEQAIACGWKVA